MPSGTAMGLPIEIAPKVEDFERLAIPRNRDGCLSV
jgi:hypothetical protein